MLNILNLLGVLINNVLIKNSKFILHSLHFLKIFRNHPKIFAIFGFIRQFLQTKVLIKKLKLQELNASIYFRDYKLGQVLGTTNRGKRDYKQTQFKGFQIGAEIRNRGKRDCKPGQEFQIGVRIINTNYLHNQFDTLKLLVKNSLDIDTQIYRNNINIQIQIQLRSQLRGSVSYRWLYSTMEDEQKSKRRWYSTLC